MRDTVDTFDLPAAEKKRAPRAGAAPAALVQRASISAAQAALAARIGQGCSTRLAALPDNAQFCLAMGDDEAPDWKKSVLVSGPFGVLEIAEGARLLLGLCGVDIDAGSGPVATPWLQAAALGRLKGTPLATAEQISRGNLPDPAGAIVLRLILRTDGHVVTTHARGAASVWLDLLARATWQQVCAPSAALDNTRLQFPVLVARHALPAAQCRRLCSGDIIVPATPLFDCAGNGSLRFGGALARIAYFSPNTLEITAMESAFDNDDYEDQYADDFQPDHASPAGSLPETGAGRGGPLNDEALDRIPVNLEFMLGRVRLSLGELRRLKDGSLLQLEEGSPASISILSSGQVVGQGEVVDIGGKLGIRLVQWGFPC